MILSTENRCSLLLLFLNSLPIICIVRSNLISLTIATMCYDLKPLELGKRITLVFVVATTRQNGTYSMLTSAKLSVDYLVVGITRELNKEPLLHCSSIYINTMWSVLQQCVYLMSYYSSTMLLP